METCRPCQNWSSAKHCPPSDCLSEPSVTSAERVRKLPSRSPLSGLLQQTMEQSRAPQRERQRATKGVFPITPHTLPMWCVLTGYDKTFWKTPHLFFFSCFTRTMRRSSMLFQQQWQWGHILSYKMRKQRAHKLYRNFENLHLVFHPPVSSLQKDAQPQPSGARQIYSLPFFPTPSSPALPFVKTCPVVFTFCL